MKVIKASQILGNKTTLMDSPTKSTPGWLRNYPSSRSVRNPSDTGPELPLTFVSNIRTGEKNQFDLGMFVWEFPKLLISHNSLQSFQSTQEKLCSQKGLVGSIWANKKTMVIQITTLHKRGEKKRIVGRTTVQNCQPSPGIMIVDNCSTVAFFPPNFHSMCFGLTLIKL